MSSEVVAPWEQPNTVVDPSDLAPEGETTPPLSVANEIKEDFGVVGEDHSFLVVLSTAAGGGGAVCMYGLSRSGKDYITDAVQACFPDEDFFKVPEESKEAALYRSAEKWNRARIHRHRDLVNLQDHIESILKHHGEGKPISREINVQVDTGDGTEWVPRTFTLDPPDCLIYFLASDNEKVDLNDYPELRNRSLVITTDASQELSDKIQYRQAQDRGAAYERNRTNQEIQAFQRHVSSIPIDEWSIGENDNPDFLHPYWEEFERQHPIPSRFVESRTDSYRFWDFVEIMTMWYHKDRITTELDYHGYKKERLLSTPADLWYAMRVYGEKMVLSAMSLRNLDKRILWFLRDQRTPHTVSAIGQVLGQAGFNVTPRDIRHACENMVNKNYLMKDDSGTIEYHATPLSTEVDIYNPIDWQKIIDEAAEDVYRLANDDVADEYVDRYCKNVTCVHPITGEIVDITEYQGFQNQIKQREEDLKKMLGTSIYESSSDSEEDTNGPEGGDKGDDTGSPEDESPGLGNWTE